jgi:ferritin-like metal-binding protein YciE
MKEGPHGKRCSGMEGLIKEGSELIAEGPDPEQLDAGLIAAAQHVEHYEMAGYGCVQTYARLLGEKQAAAILAQTYLIRKRKKRTKAFRNSPRRSTSKPWTRMRKTNNQGNHSVFGRLPSLI